MDDQTKTKKATEIQINTGDGILRGKGCSNSFPVHGLPDHRDNDASQTETLSGV